MTAFLVVARRILACAVALLLGEVAAAQQVPAPDIIGFPQLDSTVARALQPYATYFAQRRVVGVGEATHGTAEFYRFKDAFFRFLVTESSFTTLIIEANFAQSQRLNEYVQGRSTASVDSLLRDYDSWPWRTAELGSLLSWMRRYNMGQPAPEKRLAVFGCDIQYGGGRLWTREYLQRVAPTYLAAHAQWFDAKHKLTVDELTAVTRQLEANRSAYEQAAGAEAFALARRVWRTVEQNVASFAVKPSKGMKLRDQFMAENLEWVLQFRPGTKAMFWAHNGHVARAYTAKYVLGLVRPRSTGRYLAQKLGTDYVAVGTETNAGQFLAIHGKAGKLQAFELPPAPASTLAGQVRRLLGGKTYALLLNRDQPLPFGNKRITEIGAFYGNGEERFGKTNVRDNFDALFYTENSTPAHSLILTP